MPRLRLAALTLVPFAVAACSSSSSGGSAEGVPSVSPCPSPSTTGATFPAGAPTRVPHPSFADSPKRLPVTVKGQSELQFTTATPLRQAAAFVEKEYPAAGYRIIGGDAEAHEADILWAHGRARGKTRLSAAGACATTWTVLTLPGPGRESGADRTSPESDG